MCLYLCVQQKSFSFEGDPSNSHVTTVLVCRCQKGEMNRSVNRRLLTPNSDRSLGSLQKLGDISDDRPLTPNSNADDAHDTNNYMRFNLAIYTITPEPETRHLLAESLRFASTTLRLASPRLVLISRIWLRLASLRRTSESLRFASPRIFVIK